MTITIIKESKTSDKFKAFVRFCFEHGGTLKNHTQFGEMSREIDEEITLLEFAVDELTS